MKAIQVRLNMASNRKNESGMKIYVKNWIFAVVVWLVEAGKFDVVALVKQGPEMVAAAEKTVAQAIILGLRRCSI